MTKRAKLFGAVAIAALLGVGVYLKGSKTPKDDAEILSSLPNTWEYLPRSRVDQKPIVDLPWLGGSRMRLPSPPALPTGFRLSSDTSGILKIPDPSMSSGKPLATGSFLSGNWIPADGRKCWQNADGAVMGQSFVHLPHIFGTQRTRFKVEYPDYDNWSARTMEIDIPPNGIPAPAIEPFEAMVGPWKLSFKPRPWVGPSFTIDFEVSVSGPRTNGRLYLTMKDSPAVVYRFLFLVLESGHRTVVSFPAAATDPIHVRLCRMTEAVGDVELKTAPAKSATPYFGKSLFEVRRKDGSLLCRLNENLGYQFFTALDPSAWPPTLGQVGDQWIGGPPQWDQDVASLVSVFDPKRRYHAGEVFKATEYKVVESADGLITPKLPDASDYIHMANPF